ncbi:hypothetical protein TEA_013641 [Camellia sinensis var. sinensis]|uniref:F-box domain-containing protein n=1 Tax=Camellia sinensis var. sinensis TaxID=542762 RepID=A0A4S4DS51_CAMSN|nr:hypothetical protein TEA_013641 [Camellia sinensis var. sinensis]
MFTGKEREKEERSKGFNECCYSTSNNGGLNRNYSNGNWVSPGSPQPEKMRICETSSGLSQKWLGLSTSDDVSSGVEPQDADYCYIPSLDYELEGLILARVPRSEYWKLCFVNKRYLTLMKSGDLFHIRRKNGIKESSVFMSGIGESSWWAFDREFKSQQKLPDLQTDICFASGDKESFCAGWGVAFKSLGDELLVIGASSGNCVAVYTCCPDPDAYELRWRLVNSDRNRLSQFILNCSVMVA